VARRFDRGKKDYAQRASRDTGSQQNRSAQLRSLDAIREKLNRTQAAFCGAADEIPSEKWAVQPGPARWSAAEVVAHLVVVERAIVGKADRIAQKAPLPVSRVKRMHLPMWLAEARLIRLKSPVPLDASILDGKEAMLATLRVAREHTFAFLSRTENRDLSAYHWPHPFLGMLGTYEWMEMLGAHQLRHMKQIREIHRKISRK
jgi:DinB superfamily